MEKCLAGIYFLRDDYIKAGKMGKNCFSDIKIKTEEAFTLKSLMIRKKVVPDDTTFIQSPIGNKKPAKPNRTICRSFAGKKAY